MTSLPLRCPPLPADLPQVTDGPPVLCRCRCGICCRDMAIRATATDAVREPRLADTGLPIAYGPDGAPTAWMLNVLDATARDGIGPCQFLAWTPDGAAACSIHATRPDVCRALDCDTLRDMAAHHLAAWRATLAAAEARNTESFNS